MIYADSAATSRISERALQAMLPVLEDIYGNPSSIHASGQKAAAVLQTARETIASCLNVSSKEICFTSGGTESDNQAILSSAFYGKAAGKTHIVTSAFEHPAVLKTLKRLETEGFQVTYLPVSEKKTILASDVENALRPDTCLVTVMAANNETGALLPVSEIGKICRERGVLFHTDAVQAAGHIPLDIPHLGCDLLSLSAHKFHGPKGVGVLYIRSGIPVRSLLTGGEQERGKRAGTENTACIAGMAEALKESCERMNMDMSGILSMKNRLISGLLSIPGSHLNSEAGPSLPGIVNVRFDHTDAESMLLLLDSRSICASSGSACQAGSLDPSHVLLSLGLSEEEARSSLRFSLSRYNTEEEIDIIVRETKDAVSRIRKSRL